MQIFLAEFNDHRTWTARSSGILEENKTEYLPWSLSSAKIEERLLLMSSRLGKPNKLSLTLFTCSANTMKNNELPKNIDFLNYN